MSDFFIGMTGVVVGALLSGLISWWLQRSAFKEAKAERDQDRKDLQRALGQSILIKAMRIYSGLHHIRAHVLESQRLATAGGLEDDPAAVLRPLPNPPDKVHFDSAELSLVMSLSDDALTNTVLSLDIIYNSLLDCSGTVRH